MQSIKVRNKSSSIISPIIIFRRNICNLLIKYEIEDEYLAKANMQAMRILLLFTFLV